MTGKFNFINYWNDHHPEKPIRYYNHLAEFVLDAAGIDHLLRSAQIAAVSWVAGDGSPRSMSVPYALLDAANIYFTAEPTQPIVKAIRRDPRISMCWGGPTGAATLRGKAEIITDPAVTAQVCKLSASQRFPNDAAKAAIYAGKLASPTRVAIRLPRGKFITFSTGGLPRD